MTKLEAWHFLNKELARIKVTADSYNRLFDSIEVGDNRYNQILQLVLDGFSRAMSTGIAIYFDKRRDSWSLYKFLELEVNEIDTIRDKAREIIDLRNSAYSHLSKNVKHVNNFSFLTEKGLKIINETIEGIYILLHEISKANNYKESYALDWIGIGTSLDCLLEDLTFREQKHDNTI